jgi:excisionase family DNA binding protein
VGTLPDRLRETLNAAEPTVAAWIAAHVEAVLADVPFQTAALHRPAPSREPAPSCLLTAPEAAALLNIPVRWIRRHAKTLPHRKLGKYVRFEERALLRWAESRSRS